MFGRFRRNAFRRAEQTNSTSKLVQKTSSAILAEAETHFFRSDGSFMEEVLSGNLAPGLTREHVIFMQQQSIDLKLNPINISLDQISRLLQISGLNPTNEGIQGIIEELKIAPPHNFMHVLQAIGMIAHNSRMAASQRGFFKERLLRLRRPKPDPMTLEKQAVRSLCLEMWSRYIATSNEERLLGQAFQFFDRDGNGVISTEEFQEVMTELGDALSAEECALFIKLVDKNGDGEVQYDEFLAALKRDGQVLEPYLQQHALHNGDSCGERSIVPRSVSTMGVRQSSLSANEQHLPGLVQRHAGEQMHMAE